MKAFLTGSRAYGTPRADSDWDLVVLAESDEVERELRAAVGKLDLITCVDEKEYECWKRGTEVLRCVRPCTRKQAVATFKRLWKEAGLVDPYAGRSW
jgi:hypothetical protein